MRGSWLEVARKARFFLGFLDEREEEGKRDYLLTHSMP